MRCSSTLARVFVAFLLTRATVKRSLCSRCHPATSGSSSSQAAHPGATNTRSTGFARALNASSVAVLPLSVFNENDGARLPTASPGGTGAAAAPAPILASRLSTRSSSFPYCLSTWTIAKTPNTMTSASARLSICSPFSAAMEVTTLGPTLSAPRTTIAAAMIAIQDCAPASPVRSAWTGAGRSTGNRRGVRGRAQSPSPR